METLTFENNIATLDLPTLERTAKYEMARGGLPKNRPTEHFKLISDISSNIEKNTKLETKIDVIYTSERQAMQIMHDKTDGDCPIEKYLLQRITTKLLVLDGQKETTAAVGVSYTDKGIQIVFGSQVNVCSNL